MQRVNGIRDLMAFLGSFGVRPEDAVKVWKAYGADSVACIQEDPYRLCSDKIAVEFTVADKLAESLEYDRANVERVKAGVLCCAAAQPFERSHLPAGRQALHRRGANARRIARGRAGGALRALPRF